MSQLCLQLQPNNRIKLFNFQSLVVGEGGRAWGGTQQMVLEPISFKQGGREEKEKKEIEKKGKRKEGKCIGY